MKIYTDGACRGNPGPGGWGVLIQQEDGSKEMSGSETATTNNRMEMMAVIQALESLPASTTAELFTDSRYVIDGITSWIKGWKARGWRSSTGDPVKNQDLWVRLDIARSRHSISWRWVRGHNGDPGNERVDSLATGAIRAAFGGTAPAATATRPRRAKRRRAFG